MEEKRRSPRIPLKVQVKYKTPNAFLVDYAINISKGGIFIGTEKPLPVGTSVEFQILFPNMQRPVKGAGEVMWISAGKSDEPPGMGVKFNELDAEGMTIIEQIFKDFAGIKILVVDDAAVMRRLLSFWLKKIIKCEITEASDGIDAISKLKEKFDLVITDLRMPRADGLKVVEHIRKNMDDALTPIIIVTTVASGDDKEKALRLGASGYITKPLRYSELAKTVRDMFQSLVEVSARYIERMPVIGITVDYEHPTARSKDKKEPYLFLKEAYVNAIEENGGIPLLLPITAGSELIEKYMEMIDGLLITGGNFDIDPRYYGEEASQKLGEIKEERTGFEMALAKIALDKDMPVLGICGGMQLLNVLAGGALYQDIPTQLRGAINHQQKAPKDNTSHSVKITNNSRLHKIVMKDSIMVNSSHHQGVKIYGKVLLGSAVSEDGLIEAIESPNHRFVIGVQWHPEALYKKNKEQEEIIKEFIKECANKK
ncbi:MAG: TIGR02266 family protein [Nitrospirota bacterium]